MKVFLYFILIMVLVAAFIFVLYTLRLYKHDKNSKMILKYGKKTEKLVSKLLKEVFGGRNLYVNILLPYLRSKGTKYAEIDDLIITKAGIFVIEVKGQKGHITNGSGERWIQQKNYNITEFYNPFMQNETHIQILREILQKENIHSVPIYNIVVFVSNEVTFQYKRNLPLSPEEMIKFIKDKNVNRFLNPVEISNIKKVLKKYAKKKKPNGK